MAKHRVNWHLDMGEKQHREGDEIELSAELSAKLTPLGVVTPLEEEKPADVETLEPEQLAKLTKAKLVEYAQVKYSTELDPSSGKDQLLADIAALAALATGSEAK